MSNDIYKPVRYGTSLKNGKDKVQFWMVFLKHYAHPLDDYIISLPSNPPDYKSEETSFGTNEGMKVMVENCYPPCPESNMALGLPPHSDYSCLTIVLQSSPGLEILVDTEEDWDSNWRVVPEFHGNLQVLVGDHFEVLSNGKYKSVVHRATLNCEKTRISIASLHSLGMDDNMEPAHEVVDDEQNPKGYKESSFRDFLNFLARNDIAGEGNSFMDTLKIKN
ncbi:hypothetical protein REPUB_Repub07fG0010900 [Reevesia pubescens]